MARGIFSNEAGVGSAAVTHGAAQVDHPGEQALWGPLEVFIDTIIVCSITGITIVLSGLYTEGLDGTALTMTAFKTMLPGNWGQYIVLGASLLFGFSCLISFYNYMEKGWISLFGSRSKVVVKIIWLIFILIGMLMQMYDESIFIFVLNICIPVFLFGMEPPSFGFQLWQLFN